MNFNDYSDKKQVASKIASMWHEWNGARSKALKTWEEIDRYIHATDTTALDGGNNFTHTVMIPVVSEIHEDLQSIMYSTVFPHNDWLGWKPYDKDAASSMKRKKVLNYLKHIHLLNGFKETFRALIDDYIRYGQSFCEVVIVDERVPREDGTFSAGYVGARPRRISPYDIVFNPASPSFESTDKIVRSMLPIVDFKLWVDSLPDSDVNKGVLTDVLKRRVSGTTTENNTRKSAQYYPDGFGSYDQYVSSGFIEVLSFRGNVFDETTLEVIPNRYIIIVDGNEVLLEQELKGQRIFKSSWKPRPDNLWSQGALDNVIGLNYMVNHRENSKNEAIDKFIHPDRLYQGDVEEVYDEYTGVTKYLTTEGGGVTDLNPNTTILTYTNEIQIHLDMARRAARLPQQLSGFRSAGEKTAFEVQSLNDGAFRGFINKAEQFEQEFLEKIVTAEIEIARENFVSVIQVSEKDPDGFTMFLEVTEEDLRSNGKLIPYGSRRFARLLQQQAGLQQLSQSQLGVTIAPHINTYELAKVVEQVYGFEDFEFIGKFASIEEGLEAQQMQAMAQNSFVQEQSEPSLQELELDAEL